MLHAREKDRESISGSFCREPIHDVNIVSKCERASVNLCHSLFMRVTSCLHGILPVPSPVLPIADELENLGWLVQQFDTSFS